MRLVSSACEEDARVCIQRPLRPRSRRFISGGVAIRSDSHAARQHLFHASSAIPYREIVNTPKLNKVHSNNSYSWRELSLLTIAGS